MMVSDEVPVIITDPSEIAFLETVRKLPLQARAPLASLLQAMTNHEPAHVQRQAALDWAHAMGASDRLALGLMQDLIDIRCRELH